MKKTILVILGIVLVGLCLIGLFACKGSYAMEDFIVDYSRFTKEYEVGANVDLSKIAIKATFNDGTTEEIPLDRVTILLDGEEIGLNNVSKITETPGRKYLEIKYSDVKKGVWLNVAEKHIPVLTGVRLDTTNAVTEYAIKGNVTLAGLKVIALYDGGTTEKEIALTDEEITVFMEEEIVTDDLNKISDSVGSKTIKVRYTTLLSENSLVVTVVDELDKVTVSVPDTFKTAYKVGDEINLSGVKGVAEYKSGLKVNAEVKYYIGTSEVNFATLTATKGTKTVVAKAAFSGKEGTKEISFTVENYITGIDLTTTNVQLNYVVGDALTKNDFAGVKVNVEYADPQDNEQLALTADGVDCKDIQGNELNFANLTAFAGNKTVSVFYEGKRAAFTVTVAEGNTAISELLLTAPTQMTYTAGSENVTFAGLTVTAKWKEEYAKEDEVIAAADFASSGVKVYVGSTLITDFDDVTKDDTLGSNKRTVSVVYEGKTATFTITLNNSVTALAVDATNAKTAYKLNEAVNFSGLVGTATLNYGTKTVSLAELTFVTDIATVTNTVAESKTVTVSFGGQEASFTISVEDYIVGISFNKTAYETDVNLMAGSTYGFADMVVYAEWASGKERTVIASGYTFADNGITVPGTKTVTVAYGEESSTVTLTVKDILDSITVGNVQDMAYGTPAINGLKNIAVTGTFTYAGQKSINIMQEDGESLLYGVVAFALKNDLNVYETLSQLNLDAITSKSGTRYLRLTYTYNGREASCEFTVTVTEPAPGIDEFSKPKSIVTYENTLKTSATAQNNKTSQSFEGAYFVSGEEVYLVGDDNAFKFVPVLSQINIETEQVTTLTTYKTTSKVYHEGTALTEVVNGNKKSFVRNGTTYVEEDFTNNTFDFTGAAIGKTFTLSVLPSKDQFDYEDGVFPPATLTVQIVDGFNIHDSKELCVLEQNSGRTDWNIVKGELGLTNAHPNAIILHQNTIVTKDSIPTSMYYTIPDGYNIKYSYNGIAFEPERAKEVIGVELDRTFLWGDKEWPIFKYQMTAGSSFTIYGNFFDIDMSKMPLIAAFEPTDGTVNIPEGYGTYYGSYMSETSFLEVRGIRATTGSADETFNFSNFAVRGNAGTKQVEVDGSSTIQKGQGAPIFGGGLIFVKSVECVANITNIHAHECFIPFFSRNDSVVHYTNAKAYDSFQNALFVHSNSVTTLNNCYFKRAGGPLMILVEGSRRVNNEDVPLIPIVTADDNCELESYVTGQSQWFVTYGVTGNVAQLAAMDPLLQGYFGRTLVSDGQFNVIAVSVEDGGGGSAGTQAYMSYQGGAINRMNGNDVFETTKQLAAMGFVAFFTIGDVYCAPYTTDEVNYSLIKMGEYGPENVATDSTVQGTFRNPNNKYVGIYAGGMGILAQLF